jgi:hypothetical protein
MQAIKYSYDYYDNSPMDSITRVYFPKLDNINAQAYEEQIQEDSLLMKLNHIRMIIIH